MKDMDISLLDQNLYYTPTFHTIYTEEGYRQHIIKNELCVNSWSARHPMFGLIDIDKYIENNSLPIYKINAKKELYLLEHRISIETNVKHTSAYMDEDGKIFIDLYTESEAGYSFFNNLLKELGTDFSKDFFYLISVTFIKQDRDDYWSDILKLELGINTDNVEYCFDSEDE